MALCISRYRDPKDHLQEKCLNGGLSPVAATRLPRTLRGRIAVGKTIGTALLHHPALRGGIGTTGTVGIVGTAGTVVGMTATLEPINGHVEMRVDTTTTSDLLYQRTAR